MLSASVAWALPQCPDDPNAIWSICMGARDVADGQRYDGTWQDDRPHGLGTFTFSSGTTYVGHFRDGKRNGQGTLNSSDGDRYVGEWDNDLANGHGTITLASGATYVGQFRDGKRSIYGTLNLDNGERYVGQFQDDKFHGLGTYTYASGYIFFGQWQNDMRNSHGTLTTPTNERYVGEWRDDKFHGLGTYTYANGDNYVGQWQNNRRNGKGTLIAATGERYVGEWRDGQANGYGTLNFANGDIYVGQFQNDQLSGQGTLNFSNGMRLVGEWSDNLPNGDGSLTFISGEGYVGQFRDGEFHGQGVFTNANGTAKQGIWENGEFKYSGATELTLFGSVEIQRSTLLEASSGSGFAISSDGFIITNSHVIEGCQEVNIYLDGEIIPVTVFSNDMQNNLALLKADFTPRTVFALSDVQPNLLQDIYVAGHPFGNPFTLFIKVTEGVISSLSGIENHFSDIQIDASLQVGNSGGPILDEMGNIVGVAVSKLDARYMYENFGTIPENTNFGIKANVLRNILDSNGVSSPSPNRSEITRTELGSLITGGTYYVSCMMSLAQIERLRTEKVMFENLD